MVTGHERRLGSGSNPAWSPDGERIAYVVQGDQGSEVWLSDPTGRARQHVGTVSSPLFSYQPIDWSPDGTRIAIGGPDGLVMIGVWDGTSRVLDASDASSPDWSPDGLRIAYAGGTPGSLTIVSVRDGTRESPASDGAEPEDQAQAIGSHDMKPVWSPDGRRIAFIRDETPAIVDLATGAVTTVGVGRSATHLAWSPAGRTLAVVASTDDGYAVVLVSPEGGGSHVLASIPRFARETAERGAENHSCCPQGWRVWATRLPSSSDHCPPQSRSAPSRTASEAQPSSSFDAGPAPRGLSALRHWRRRGTPGSPSFWSHPVARRWPR